METRWDEVALLLQLLIAAGCNIETSIVAKQVRTRIAEIPGDRPKPMIPCMGDEHPQSDVNYSVTDGVSFIVTSSGSLHLPKF